MRATAAFVVIIAFSIIRMAARGAGLLKVVFSVSSFVHMRALLLFPFTGFSADSAASSHSLSPQRAFIHFIKTMLRVRRLQSRVFHKTPPRELDQKQQDASPSSRLN